MSSQGEAVAALKCVRVQAELIQTIQTLHQLELLMECIGARNQELDPLIERVIARNENYAQIKELYDSLDARSTTLYEAFHEMISEYMESVEGGADAQVSSGIPPRRTCPP